MFDRYTYMYVEDDPLSREIMQVVMETAMGVTTLEMFEDSGNFIERLFACSVRPDIILLDVHLEPYSGFELLHMIRANGAYRDTKIVALTASVMNEEVKKLRTSGFDGAIAKPLDIEAFPELIERILMGEEVWHIA